MAESFKPSSQMELFHRLARETDVESFFHLAAEGIAALLHADGAALIVREEPSLLRYRFFHGLPAPFKHLSIHAFSDRQGTAGAAVQTGRPVLAEDYATSVHAMPEFVKTGLKASLSTPVRSGDRILGVLAIAWFAQPYQPPDAAAWYLLEVIADFMGAALHRSQMEQRITYLAMHDPLTGAANRNLFFIRLEHAMELARRRERLMAVAVFDLDHFKMINDQLGHSLGDTLLREVRVRTQDLIRRCDTVARLGGDEFALILEDVRCYDEIQAAMQRVRQGLRMRWGSELGQVAVSISLGVTVFPLDEGSPQDLLRDADAAMYEAKRAGGNAVSFFSHHMARDRATL